MQSNSTGNTTGPSQALIEFLEYYDKMKDLMYPTMGVTMTIICIVGMVANLLNIIALSRIIKKSRLPVYRCFLGLAVADFLVRLLLCSV